MMTMKDTVKSVPSCRCHMIMSASHSDSDS
jgi:hypothetical protein